MPGFIQTELLATARGPERERHIADQLMKDSRYTAAQCAQDILHAAGKRELYIVLPKSMHRVWRFKRWMPQIFVRQFPHLRERFSGKPRQSKD
jgi:short-subunit dehydrogenase